MSYTVNFSMDGIYDENGKPLTVEDFINLQIKNGIRVTRKMETTKVYKLDTNGELTIELQQCEVITFSH